MNVDLTAADIGRLLGMVENRIEQGEHARRLAPHLDIALDEYKQIRAKLLDALPLAWHDDV